MVSHHFKIIRNPRTHIVFTVETISLTPMLDVLFLFLCVFSRWIKDLPEFYHITEQFHGQRKIPAKIFWICRTKCPNGYTQLCSILTFQSTEMWNLLRNICRFKKNSGPIAFDTAWLPEFTHIPYCVLHSVSLSEPSNQISLDKPAGDTRLTAWTLYMSYHRMCFFFYRLHIYHVTEVHTSDS